MTSDLTLLDQIAAITANRSATVENKYAAIEALMLTRRMPQPAMTLADYSRQLDAPERDADRGDPTPVTAIALVFGSDRTCVCVRVYGSKAWQEVMSAPRDTEDGVACGIDCCIPEAIACAPFAEALGVQEIP